MNVLQCQICHWQGEPDSLIAIDPDPQSINDFVHCPDCKSSCIEEVTVVDEITSTLNDFFGDGSADNIPECLFCGGTEGELVVSISDHYGPTHWHHVACEEAANAKKGTPVTPTWDEAMDEAQR